MRRCDRYLFSQLTVPFLIGLFTFAVILLGDTARQLGAALMGSRVSMWLLARYLSCYIPHALSWAMPVGTVVGVAMTMTLLTNHGEITALRTGGLSFPRLCLGLVFLGVVASVLSFGCGEYLSPPATRRARELFAEIGLTQPIVQEQYNVFFRDGPTRRLFYIAHMNPASNQLEGVTIWQQDSAGRLAAITAADWAETRGRIWYLRQGATVRLGPDGQQVGPVAKFGEQEIVLWAALQDYYASRLTTFEMSAAELGDLIGTVGPSGRDTQREEVEYHFKYSMPLACLVFALCAAPISFRLARHGSFVGVVVAVLIVFLYNGVRSWTLAFGLAGSLHPILAGWTPDVIFAALGMWLLTSTR
jgi:lipopolysaccharide export system permease protein